VTYIVGTSDSSISFTIIEKISQPIESYTFIIIVLIFFLVVICAPLMSIAIDAALDVTLNGEFRLFLH